MSAGSLCEPSHSCKKIAGDYRNRRRGSLVWSLSPTVSFQIVCVRDGKLSGVVSGSSSFMVTNVTSRRAPEQDHNQDVGICGQNIECFCQHRKPPSCFSFMGKPAAPTPVCFLNVFNSGMLCKWNHSLICNLLKLLPPSRIPW